MLLLHGFAGTPVELIRLGEWLAEHGFLAHAPLLAGHGTSPEEMALTRADDWIRSANQGLEELMARCRTVGVAGQSMGGTLALHLAATRPEVRAVVTQAAMLRLSDWRLRLLPALHPLVRWDTPSGRVDLYLPERAGLLHSYRRRPTPAILELVRLGRQVEKELRAIWQPLLVLHGGRDGVVGPANAGRIVGGVGSSIRQLQLFPRSGHGLSVDVDSLEVAELAGQWFARHLPEVPA